MRGEKGEGLIRSIRRSSSVKRTNEGSRRRVGHKEEEWTRIYLSHLYLFPYPSDNTNKWSGRLLSLSREYCSETEKVEYDQKGVAPNYLQPLPPSLPLALWALIATAREMISISDGVEEGKRERPESYLRLSRKEEEDRGQTNIRERERNTPL